MLPKTILIPLYFFIVVANLFAQNETDISSTDPNNTSVSLSQPDPAGYFMAFEYVPNIPNAYIGTRISIIDVTKKWGFVFSMSISEQTTTDAIYDNLTKNPFGDLVQDTVYNYLNMSLGYAYPIHKSVWPYFTLGYVGKTCYLKMYDATGILGHDGTYFTPYVNGDKSSITLGTGIIFKLNKIVVSLGAEYPAAFLIGIGFASFFPIENRY